RIRPSRRGVFITKASPVRKFSSELGKAAARTRTLGRNVAGLRKKIPVASDSAHTASSISRIDENECKSSHLHSRPGTRRSIHLLGDGSVRFRRFFGIAPALFFEFI